MRLRLQPRQLVWVLLPLLLFVFCLTGQPFSKTLVHKNISTRTLTAAQIANLRVAARHLDGVVLMPNETFSFNKVIGPRTRKRGYLAAPSYLEGENLNTVGGGICLLSSAVYQLALEAGLKIDQRVPHLRTIHSVPPGLDATVWYGQHGGADLKLSNTLKVPVRLQAKVERSVLKLSLHGKRPIKSVSLQRLISRRSPRELLVTVLRNEQMISRDLYRLSGQSAALH